MADVGITVDVSGLLAKSARAQSILERTGLLKAIGLRQLKWIDDNFRSNGQLAGGWKPLSPFTIMNRIQNSSRPLQDTGILRASFTPGDQRGANIFNVNGDQVTIGSALSYASYHEKGTGPIYPVHAKALKIDGRAGRFFFKHTKGIPQRKILPDDVTAKDLGIKIVTAKVKEIDRG